jgi:glycosyltransferase involved in cell wall biosynthesis
MNICLVAADFYPNIGGIAAHVVELGKSLVAAGHNVFVVTRPIGQCSEPAETWQGMQVYRVDIPRQRPFYNLLLKPWLRKFAKRHKIDVTHIHGMRPLEASRGLPCPVIFTNHTSGFLKRLDAPASEYLQVGKRLTHLAHVIAPSEQLCEATRTVGYTGPVTFIPNGVDAERFHPLVPAQHSDRENEAITVLLARRLVAKNGVLIFAEAMAKLADLDIRIVIAGDGELRSRVLDILENAGLKDKTEFLGIVDNEDMPEIYQSADISVLPSFMEATSITGLESMASGLPLVGTNVGGIPGIIEDNVTGLLVPPGEPDSLAQAIKKLVENSALRQTMGKAARTRVETEFTWQGIAQRTLDIYHQVISAGLKSR